MVEVDRVDAGRLQGVPRRRPRNTLGIALQLCVLRHPGPPAPGEFPWIGPGTSSPTTPCGPRPRNALVDAERRMKRPSPSGLRPGSARPRAS